MGLTYKGVEPDEITYNNLPVDSVTYNGVEVWAKKPLGIKSVILPYNSGNELNNALSRFLYATPKYYIFSNTSKDTITILNKETSALETKPAVDFNFIDDNGDYGRNRILTGYRVTANNDGGLLKFNIYKLNENALTEDLYDAHSTTESTTGISVSIAPVKNSNKCVIFVSNTSTLLFKNFIYDADNKTLNEIIFEGLPEFIDLSTAKFESAIIFGVENGSFTIVPMTNYTRVVNTRIQRIASEDQRYYVNLSVQNNKIIFENFDLISEVRGNITDNVRAELVNATTGLMPYIDIGIGTDDLKVYGTKFKSFNNGIYEVETEPVKATPPLLSAAGVASMGGYGEGLLLYTIHTSSPYEAQAFYIA